VRRFARVALGLALALLAAPLAEARGGRIGAGVGPAGGRRSGGGKAARSGAQGHLLASDCVREENVRRMRHADW
jgi:hypothetical protein